MTATFEHLLEHQKATDTTDHQLVYILCKFIDNLDDDGHLPHTADLFGFVVDELSQLPDSLKPDCNHYDDPRFTDEDKDMIVRVVMEEVADCSLKEKAHEQIAGEPLVELISYACDDPEEVARYMKIENSNEPLQFLSGNFSPDEKKKFNEFIQRMKLVDDCGEVTELGQEFIDRNT